MSFIYTHTHRKLSSLPLLPLVDANRKTYKALMTTLPLAVKVKKRSNQKSEFQILGLLSNLNLTFFSSDGIAPPKF